MSISASRLAVAIASRLRLIAPPPFVVRASGSDLVVDHPEGRGSIIPFDWMEDEDEDRSAAELAELAVSNVLNSFQDDVSEATREPWPPLHGRPREMAPYDTRCDGIRIHFWYGHSEQTPVIAFEPIALSDVVAHS